MNKGYSYTSTASLSYKDFLAKTFLLVAVGLAISTGLAFLFTLDPYAFLYRLGTFGMIACIIAELAIVIYFSSRILKMSKGAAYACFFIYSILNGVNLSVIFFSYSIGSIVYALGMTTVLFICMSIIGYSTNIDLSKFSSLFMIGLVVIIVGTLINNFFIKSSLADWIICCVGIVLFLGLIAFDMQKLRNLYNQTFSDPELSSKMTIYGALELYLDFINLFIRILSIFGKRRD